MSSKFLQCSCGKEPRLKNIKPGKEVMEVTVQCECGASEKFSVFLKDFLVWCNTPEIFQAFKLAKMKAPKRQQELM